MHKRPRVATVLTTIYFAGVLASTSIMYGHAIEPWYSVVGVTFFAGIVAIYFTARSRDEIVVYLEKKEENVVVQERKSNHGSQLGDVAIEGDPQQVLNVLCNRLNAGQGAIYTLQDDELTLKYGYAVGNQTASFKLGEGLVGRVAAENARLYLDELPENYITVFSGLGNASPAKLALIPIKNGVIELATFTDINESTLKHIETSCSEILK
jgi:hypothetical protein